MATVSTDKLKEVAKRIREMREICDITEADMAKKTEVSLADYRAYENGELDFPFTFIHKCSLAFGIGITDLLEGQSAHLSSYTVTRKGQGQETAKEDGIEIQNLAPLFRKKIAEPYWVRYEYSEELQNKPIHLTKHSGQEFDFVMSGRLKVQIGENVEYLSEGDSIYYNSSTPHGMIAVDGRDCLFVAVVLSGENADWALGQAVDLHQAAPEQPVELWRGFTLTRLTGGWWSVQLENTVLLVSPAAADFVPAEIPEISADGVVFSGEIVYNGCWTAAPERIWVCTRAQRQQVSALSPQPTATVTDTAAVLYTRGQGDWRKRP